jgi:hypothetical protein
MNIEAQTNTVTSMSRDGGRSSTAIESIACCVNKNQQKLNEKIKLKARTCSDDGGRDVWWPCFSFPRFLLVNIACVHWRKFKRTEKNEW